MQTPHRFRTKRQLWAYSELALETRTSADYRYVEGQLRHSKRLVSIRGLNKDHNHDLKGLFKAAAIALIRAPSGGGPLALGSSMDFNRDWLASAHTAVRTKKRDCCVTRGRQYESAEQDRGRLHELEARNPCRLLVERQRARTPCPPSKLCDQHVRKCSAPLL